MVKNGERMGFRPPFGLLGFLFVVRSLAVGQSAFAWLQFAVPGLAEFW